MICDGETLAELETEFGERVYEKVLVRGICFRQACPPLRAGPLSSRPNEVPSDSRSPSVSYFFNLKSILNTQSPFWTKCLQSLFQVFWPFLPPHQPLWLKLSPSQTSISPTPMVS